jgi:hypothetical protein
VGRLTPDDQKAIRQAAKESVPYMRKLWDEREEKSLATVKAGGAQIIEVDKPVPGRDEAGLRQVHHRPEAQGHDQAHSGQQVSSVPTRRVRHCHAASFASRGIPIHVHQSFCALIARSCLKIGVAGLVLLLLAVLYQVFGRYVLNNTPTWAESLALLLVLYVTMLGCAVGVRDAGHIGMELLGPLLPERFVAAHRDPHPPAHAGVRRADGLAVLADARVGERLQDPHAGGLRILPLRAADRSRCVDRSVLH